MNKRNIKKVFERQTPDVLGAVLSECEQTENKDWQVVRQPKKRSPWLAVACAAAVLAVVVSIGMLAWKGVLETPMTEPTETTAPIEMAQLVTDAYRGTWGDYEHAIPQINLDGPYANAVNAEIEQSYQLDENGILCETSDHSYEYFVSGDILSLVLHEYELRQTHYYQVYTLHISDGSEATRAEVLSQAGVTLESYLQRLSWDLGNTYSNHIPTDALAATLVAIMRPEDLNAAKPFLSEDGLCYLASVHYGETANHEIFYYDKPVEEAANYKNALKQMGSTCILVQTISESIFVADDGIPYKAFVPVVLLDSEYAAEVNREIQEICAPYFDENGNLNRATEISYYGNSWEGVLSLMLTIEEGEQLIWRVYTFDIDDGSRVEAADMLATINVTEEEFRQNMLLKLADAYCSLTDEELTYPIDTLSPEFLKTVSDKNIDALVPMYWDIALVAVGTVYTPGKEHMTYLHMSLDPEISPYAEKMVSLYQIHLPNQAITPVDPDEPVVEAYSNSTSYRYDGVDYVLSCSVPKLLLESAYAQEINRELADYYNSAMKNDGTWAGGNVSYECFVNGDILSLVVYLFDPENSLPFEVGHQNMIYNIRLSDGSKVSTDEILQAAGVTREDFYARAREFLGTYCLQLLPNHVWETLLEDPNSDAEGRLKGPFSATVAEKNLEQVVPYLTEDGTLHFAGHVYIPTGGFALEAAMSSVCEDFELSPYYEEVFKLCKE